MKNTTLISLIVLIGATAQTNAAVTVLDYYKLGDNDSGAVAGNVGNSTTTDSAGSSNLTRTGSPTYSSDVPFSSIGGSPNTFSMLFSSADYSFASRLTDAQTNFGFEVFVKATSTTGNAGIVYNGKAGSSGFGILRQGTTYVAELGTNPGTFFGSTTVSLNSWVYLALVRDGTTSTFYVNGISAGTSAATPLFGSNPFRIGSSVGTDFFTGGIDQVRLFTFAPGAFITGDLLINQVPEPSTWVMLSGGLAATIIGAFGRKRRRLTGRCSECLEAGTSAAYAAAAPSPSHR